LIVYIDRQNAIRQSIFRSPTHWPHSVIFGCLIVANLQLVSSHSTIVW